MISPRSLALLALGSTQIWTASASEGVEPAKRQDAARKYCPGGTSICFSEYTVATHNIVYRIAIPDVKSAPFDILLQIVAPVAVGWAGLAWGGKMSSNPLTVAWANGKTSVVSSRFTTGHSTPGAYAGATYTVLPSTTANATHWELDVLCRGCSQWSGGSLDPNGVNALAWAKSSKAVTAASNNASAFSIHDAKAVFAHDFSAAKIPQGVFDALAYELSKPAPSSAPPAASSTAVVLTSVVTLPIPTPSVVVTPPGPTVISTRLTALPPAQSSMLSKPPVVVSTRVTQLPPKPETSTVLVIPDPPKPSTPPVVISTRITQLPPKPLTSTVYVLPTTPAIVTVTVTRATPPAVTTVVPAPAVTPPWVGGPPWRGGGRPPWRGGRPWGTGEDAE
ncbi:hypothetical protein B0H63DRAFT_439249 [Podospora didyma]|uniref:Cellobiose dehydrogenase-like cytochrome domain-containing protein n=1 Tax=Podospora didyma TaxID=330526 RepID=A0AAE0K8G8_9PEZI|nr:hypothetical protein B0H63DRAFT_439249 [Podospora didyma]